MKFAHPEILWALIALAIPILVHLFNFRRFKRVSFTNVRFLREVQQETKSRSRLKHLLILTSRLLAILFMVLAFAQPFIPLDENSKAAGKRSVSLYVDNSYSMDAQSEEGRLLAIAKQKAVEVVESYEPTDQFQVLTNDFEGRHQRFYNREDVLELIDEIQVSSSIKNVDEIIQRQQDLLLRKGEGELTAFILSDLQKSTHTLSEFVPDSAIELRFVPELASSTPNVWIDSVWFEGPVRTVNQPEELHLRIRHTALEGINNLPMKLNVNGSQKAIGSFNLVPGTYTDTTLFYTVTEPGIQHCEVSLQDHPITYDDNWYFSYSIANQINILRIKSAESGNSVAKAFGNDPFYKLTSTNQGNVNFGEISEYGLVILDQLQSLSSGLVREMNQFIADGGSVLFIPHRNGDLQSYSELLLSGGAPAISTVIETDTKVSDINLNHPIYGGVFDRIPENIDLPKVQSYLKFQRNSKSNDQPLLTLQNGDPFLFRSTNGQGQLFVSAVSLDSESSNFDQHALFVPSLLRMAEYSNLTRQTSFAQGEDQKLKLRKNPLQADQTFRLQRVNGDGEFIPRYRSLPGGVEVYLNDQNASPGNYNLVVGDSTFAVLGMNFSRKESAVEPWELNEWEQELLDFGWTNASVVDASIESVGKLVEQLDEGKVLWEWFIWLAIAMLIFEFLLIKFWKT